MRRIAPHEGNKMAKNEVTTIDAETGEVLESTAVVTTSKAASGVMIGGIKYEVAALVNVPTLKHESGQTLAFKVLQPIYDTENEITEEVEVEGRKVMATRRNTISVVRVEQLSDGKTYEYVCNAITADSFRTAYPEAGYIGRVFAVHKGNTVAGKRYKEVQILELKPQ
jgi:hypothetical protein